MKDPNISPDLSSRLTVRDGMMLVNMVLFIVVGSLIFYRAFNRNGSWLAYLIGALFIVAGGYRFYLFCRVLKDNQCFQKSTH